MCGNHARAARRYLRRSPDIGDRRWAYGIGAIPMVAPSLAPVACLSASMAASCISLGAVDGLMS